MESKSNQEDKNACGPGHGKGCCSGRLAVGLLLLMLGGFVGYFMGKCSAYQCGKMSRDCGMSKAACPFTGSGTPATQK